MNKGVSAINLSISDLKYEYSKKATGGDNPKFTGKPDSGLFNREEEYEVIPMLNKVLDELGTLNPDYAIGKFQSKQTYYKI